MRRLLLPLVFALAIAGPASAATNPDLLYLQKTLKADMVKAFKKQAPSLKVTTVTCQIPKSGGAKTQCKAYFTVSSVKGYYPVTATFVDLGGKVTWTAASPKCFDTKTKKYVSCNS